MSEPKNETQAISTAPSDPVQARREQEAKDRAAQAQHIKDAERAAGVPVDAKEVKHQAAAADKLEKMYRHVAETEKACNGKACYKVAAGKSLMVARGCLDGDVEGGARVSSLDFRTKDEPVAEGQRRLAERLLQGYVQPLAE